MPERWVSRLFSKFQVRYVHKWTSALTSPELIELAVVEWGQELAGLSPEQVRHGLESLEGDWPPSAPGFRKACLGGADARHQSAAYRPFRALPGKPSSRETALMFLRGMRRSIYRRRSPVERYMAMLIEAESRK